MSGRIACFVAGLPVGALAALAGRDPSPLSVALAASAVGVALLVLVPRLDRARGGSRAAGACAGLVALPACGLALLGAGPAVPALLALCVAILAIALARGATASAPGPGRLAAAAAISLVAGAAGLLLLSGLVAALGAEAPRRDQRLADAIYDLDAQVATRALPGCRQRAAAWRVLLERGARPRLAPGDQEVWFDAEAEDGTRQVHRLARATGDVVCWTCGQPGDNARPVPGPGASLVFDSDREATWSDPANTEIYRMRATGAEPPRAAQRLTYSPGPDDHAVLGPSPDVVAWSTRRGGRYFVATASFATGHGGLLLGNPAVAYAGGADWTAPLGWSADARSLVVVRGNPFRPLRALAIDLTTEESVELAGDVAPASVGFSDDGGWAAVATSADDGALGRLPDSLGFLLGPFAARAELGEPLFGGSGLASGPTAGPLDSAPLPDALRTWGAPTGVALASDGSWLVLGQRRGDGAERLVEVQLQCSNAEPGGDPP